jgi:signal transduction histidine kinase/DNA-binding response OmpR family regulator
MATILVVDDQPTNREFLTTLLAYQGHRLFEATGGAEALELVYAQRPDLVIADIVMPAMDGYEFVRQLRADSEIAATPVMFYTATYNEPEARLLARACGVEHILSKPAEPRTILDTVALALAKPVPSASAAPPADTFERDHTRLLTDKLARKVTELEAANRALERHAAALEQEVALRTQIERRQALQVVVTRILAESDTRYEAIPLILEALGLGLGCSQGELWRADPQMGLLRWEQGWWAPPLGPTQVTAAGLADAIAPGSGVCGRVWASARPEWVERATADTHSARHSIAGESGSRSAFAFPIRGGAGVFGVMLFFCRDARPADEALLEMLADIGSQIGQFFERKRAEEQLWQYTQRLRTLHTIDQAILALQPPDAIAQAALHHILQLIPCRRASLMALELETNQAITWAAVGEGTSLSAGTRFLLQGQPMLETLQRGEPYSVEDAREHSPVNPFLDAAQREGLRSVLSVPLLVRLGLLGMLNLASERPGAFAPEFVDIAREVGDQIAIAIQNARLFEQVQVGRERLQHLSRQLVVAQEDERRRLARELHDEIGQALTAAQLNLQGLLTLRDVRELPGRLEDSMALIESLLQQVRALSLDLRPSMLDDLGLVPALRWYLSRQAERAGFQAQLFAEPLEPRLPAELETTCYRIAQETLTNIVRHASARQVVVELRQSDGELRLTIRDDGAGFDVRAARARAARGASLGLLGMQERALLVGGEVTIESAPGQGAEVRARFPLMERAGGAALIERRKESR